MSVMPLKTLAPTFASAAHARQSLSVEEKEEDDDEKDEDAATAAAATEAEVEELGYCCWYC